MALGLLSQTAKKKVPWNKEEKEMLCVFFELMVSKVEKLIQEGLFQMKDSVLSSIKIISQHLAIPSKYVAFIDSFKFYDDWKQSIELYFKDL